MYHTHVCGGPGGSIEGFRRAAATNVAIAARAHIQAAADLRECEAGDYGVAGGVAY